MNATAPAGLWRKLGLVFDSDAMRPTWAAHTAISPTPVRHRDGQIRVYAGMRDAGGVSRIGYVDLDRRDPTRVLRVSPCPVLDIGRDGCFDDNGMILGDVIEDGADLLMFYVGFQLVAKAKFLALTGWARSSDDGETFKRVDEGPFLGRASGQTMIAAVHSVHSSADGWRLWYAAGDGWQWIDGRPFPRYEIRLLETRTLQPLSRLGSLCLPASRPGEYRIGRPRVVASDGGFEMYFTCGTVAGDYGSGRALSPDARTWTRDEQPFGLPLSAQGWDSRHLCYVAPFEIDGRRYAFYNGNDMGYAGFGCALWEPDGPRP